MHLDVTMGRPTPLGATVTNGGINFAVYSQNATAVWLDLFCKPADIKPFARICLDDARHRTGDIWHVFIPGLGAGQLYGWRMDGPYLPMQGHRFNRHKLLADPFAKAFVGDFDMFDDALYGYDRTSSMRDRSFSQLDSARATAKSAAIAPAPVIWDTEARPRYPLEESIIYECHVKGMTAHPSSQVTHPGTYRGLCEKIPHLKALGVTTIELLPVAQYNALEPPTLVDPVTKEVHRNYWGYATIGFFSPHASYASVETPCGVVEEFRQMVRAFHEAQIEVILDVVFNHSGEGNERGATIAFRGLDNAVYYMLDAKGRYANYTGCGNTMNCNHPVMKHLIIECLRYWVVEMHIDGFRFDLATILGRSNKGEWISDPNLSLLNDIASDPVLRGCKLIAEAWDAAGLYKVGRFPLGWAEWNGMFRDDVRRFWRGDNGTVFGLAQRIAGSKDLFGDKQTASHSVNFITAHDGFTLRDCCSYLQKHNKRNGEQNRDGCNDNFSDNFGVEGETRDGAIRSRRLRRAKNMMATLFLSRGMPMILGGDEIWRTQRGNNNGFCQDNDISWHDWRPSSESEEMFAFCQKCIALRKAYKALRQTSFGDPQHRGHTNDLRFHGVHLLKPDWLDISHSLAFELTDGARGARFYVAMNAWCEALTFEIPRRRWYKIVDTAQPSPQDFIMPDACPPQVSGRVVVEPDSLCVLISFEHS